MAKSTNTNTGMIVGGLAAVGLSIGGLMLASNNAEVANNTNVASQTEQVANLPAVNARLDSIEANIEDNQDERSAEINRREEEMFDFIEILFKAEERVDDMILKRIDRLEQEIFDMVP